MTRVLLVYHDVDVADVEADELRKAGYEVDRCAGPIGGDPCPVLRGEPCWQVDRADVLVYDVWESSHGGHDLVTDLHDLHPDKPLVLTSSRPNPDEADAVAPTRASLVAAVAHALRTHVPETSRRPASGGRRERRPFQGARW